MTTLEESWERHRKAMDPLGMLTPSELKRVEGAFYHGAAVGLAVAEKMVDEQFADAFRRRLQPPLR